MGFAGSIGGFCVDGVPPCIIGSPPIGVDGIVCGMS
jgi:hypothetical protein